MEYEKIRALLLQAYSILGKERKRNWIRGVSQVISALDNDGLNDARDIYLSMLRGKESFADYSISLNSIENPEENEKANDELTRVRNALWEEFR